MRGILIGTGAAALLLVACSSGGNGTAKSGQPVPAGSVESVESYCAVTKAYVAQPPDEFNRPDANRRTYEDAAQQIHAALAVAPAEIRPDVQTMSDGLDRLMAVLDKYNYDADSLAAAPDDLGGFDQPTFDAAAARVAAFNDRECK